MTAIDYGVLSQLMQDEAINTIYVNDPQHVYVWHRDEGYRAADVSFKDAASLANFAQGLAKSMGQDLDTHHPIAELRLADGSHTTLMVAPIATQSLRREV